MSQKIHEAELALQACVTAMRSALQCAVEDALPRSVLDGETEEEDGNIPDTLQQRREEELRVESKRIRVLSDSVLKSFDDLRRSVIVLGGGMDGEGRIVDVPIPLLDREIEMLSIECNKHGAEMLKLYSEAEAIEARLVGEMNAIEIPPM
ncbi:hypothetical protein AGDE_08049 [Angomonas deanei]|uniref:Uncharacterized protein n=1 Tax=Angomonas deanei TaxID=59799 RepID=A0A7G2CG81_9TRYP|nr:hypothetical protein AGDE_08049 [Angomonas deanei]CAD2217192.1 hypothetical protein, conserved [Angomonas deanei]|eukprot:EPY34043.1 hypothetical protein AGDE_08049 [Angomonas deanei]